MAKVVYGSIIGLALVVALAEPPAGSGRHDRVRCWAPRVAVGLAEVYSEVVGAETSNRHSVTRHQLAHMVDDAVAVGFGVAFPALSSSWRRWWDSVQVDTAFTLAKWTGLGLIGFYGYWAARFAGAPVHRALVRGALVALVGGALIVLKSLLH